MGPKLFEWVWNQSASLSGVARWFGYEDRAFGMRIGRRFFGVVVTVQSDSQIPDADGGL